MSRTRLSNFTFTFHFRALEKEMATHSSVLAWRIPGTGEPGGLPSMGSHRVRHDWSDLAAAAADCLLCPISKVNPTVDLCACLLTCVQLFATPQTAAHKAPLSVGFFWQEYWSGLHYLLQGILLTQGSNLWLQRLLHLQVDWLPPSQLGIPLQSSIG